mmetsp:Transcript_49145/g.117067  ORF Transcript_49145/g.117067 Transcript_49145/m.117067 type:complete len:598 (-) Transcript_49145:127-1920(-)
MEEATAKAAEAAEAKGFISGLSSAWRVCEKALVDPAAKGSGGMMSGFFGRQTSPKGSGDLPKELALISTAIKEEKLVDALVAAKQWLEAAQDGGSGASEVMALTMVAHIHLAMGRPKEALLGLSQANEKLTPELSACLAPVMSSYCIASTARRDHDEALKAAARLIAEFRSRGDETAEAFALRLLAEAFLAKSSPREAEKAAQKALTIFRKLKNSACEVVLLGLVIRCATAAAKPTEAVAAAEELQKTFEASKNIVGQANALVLRVEADRTSEEALTYAGQAVELAKRSGDKNGLVTALVAYAETASLQAKELQRGVASAQEACELCKELGDKSLEATAQLALARASMASGDGEVAKSAASQASKLFENLQQPSCLADCKAILNDIAAGKHQAKPARVVLDPQGIALLEMSESATSASLEDAVKVLQSATSLKAIVLIINGVFCHEDAVSPQLKNGAFIMGLRSIGVPIVSCGFGRVQGYAWSLMMQMDYKIAAAEATFVMPLHVPTSILKKISSATVVAEMCLKAGPMSALDMMGVGLIHTCQAGKEKAIVAALEFASRLKDFPQPVKHLLGQGDYHEDYMLPKHPTARSVTAGWF